MMASVRRSIFMVSVLVWAAVLSAPARAVSPPAHAVAAHAVAAHAIAAHAIAMHDEPALPADFTHFPYADPGAPKGGRLILGVQGTFDSLNPYNLGAGTSAQGIAGYTLQSMMMRSLDEPFTMYGLVAQSIETDAERSYVVFRIDPRARFSDGTPVTATDVLFSFDLLRRKGRPQQRDAYNRVRKAEALDALTVRYDLRGLNDREMPLTLAYMVVLPAHATDAEHFTEASLTPLVGTGPYVVTRVVPGQRIVLRRNPAYWGRDLPSQRGLYNFDEIRIEYYRDGNTLFEAFKAGLYDFRQEYDARRWTSAYDFPALRDGRVVRESVRFGLPKGIRGFVFNMRKAMFADIRVREALAMMLDAEWINAILYSGASVRSRSFFDDSDLGSAGRPADARERQLLAPYPDAVRPAILEGTWVPPTSDGSGRDRPTARRALDLLAGAGWELKGANLVRRDDGTPLAFEIMVADRDEERLALVYAHSLSRIGVQARIRLVDDVQYQRRRQRFEFDMMLGMWTATPSPGYEQRSRWGSDSADQEASLNLAGVRSPAVDAMIAAFLAAKTRAEFVDAVRAYDRVLLSGAYIVPLFYTREQWIAYSARLARPKVTPLFGVAVETWWRKSDRGLP